MPRRSRYPKALERSYRKRLVARQRSLTSALKKALGPALKELGPGINERAAQDRARLPSSDASQTGGAERAERVRRLVRWHHDNAGADASTLHRVLAAAYVAWLEDHPPAGQEDDLARRARQVERVATARVVRELVTLGAKDREWLALDDAQAAFVAENVRLITSLSDQVVAQVEGTITASLSEGRTVRELQAALDERFAMGQRRALLIARDQVGTYNAQVTRTRHQELGVDRFIWSTAGDSNVRGAHAALEGERFRYDEPPTEGLPGVPIGCRCTAIPVVPVTSAA